VELAYSAIEKEEVERVRRIERLLGKQVEEDEVVGRPLRESLSRFAGRLGNHPGRSSGMLLLPGDEPGSVRALVRLRETKSKELVLHASNSGTDTTGEWMLGGSYKYFQVSDADDVLGLAWGFSDTLERKSVLAGYRRPLIGPDLLELGLSFSYSNYDASSFAVTRIDFEGESTVADLELVWRPLEWESESSRFALLAGLSFEDTWAANSLVVGRGEGQFVSPRIGVSLKTKEKFSRTSSSLTISGNVHRISASDRTNLGGFDVEDRFERLAFSHLRSFKVGEWLSESGIGTFALPNPSRHNLFFKARAAVGLKNVRHLPQRQFILGGTGSVRGYPEAPAAGDDGYLLSLEYRMRCGEAIPVGKGERITASLAPFVDFGETFVNDPKSYESDHQLAGAGVGLQFGLPYGGSARVHFAKPLKEIVNSGAVLEGTRSGDGRIHAMISWEF
ncbi:MAG: BamA/TamA family outer membrane protein, partial [Opitutales bacterium]